jgi:hypothetical protein
MKIGQLSFVQLTEPAETPYGSDKLGSKYQGQRGPTPSMYWKNFAAQPDAAPEPQSPDVADAEGGGARGNFERVES